MSYVDGFVIAIPKKNLKMYMKMAKDGKKMWMKFGAIDYKECLLEDPKVSMGGMAYAKLIKTKPTETVLFSFITFKNRKHRDAVNKKVMAYFTKQYDPDMPMPFDPKRMAYGGFKAIVEA